MPIIKIWFSNKVQTKANLISMEKSIVKKQSHLLQILRTVGINIHLWFYVN